MSDHLTDQQWQEFVDDVLVAEFDDLDIDFESLSDIDDGFADDDSLPTESIDGDEELEEASATIGSISLISPGTYSHHVSLAKAAANPALIAVFKKAAVAYAVIKIVDDIIHHLATSTDDLSLSIDDVFDIITDLWGGSNKCSKRRARTLKRNWRRIVKRSKKMREAADSGDAERIRREAIKLQSAARKFRKDARGRSSMFTRCYRSIKSRNTTLKKIATDALRLHKIIREVKL
jgi:hypothetical protein